MDQTLALLREGYGFLPGRRERYGCDVFDIRLLGERTTCLVGADAARLLYDGSRFRRTGAMPAPVLQTLMGRGGVQTLDDAAHHSRKALFMELLGPEHVAAVRERVAAGWREVTAERPSREPVVVFDEAARVLVRAVCDWAGVPLAADDTAAAAADMAAMVDGFAAAGPRHLRARLARRSRERWVGDLVRSVRGGAVTVSADSPVAVVSDHQDQDGVRLDDHTAAVEILNLLRPTVAVAWFVTDAVHAAHLYPGWRERLRDGDDATLERFVQEVRRFYPFAPAVGARVRQEFDWRGHHFPRGRLVVVDVDGTDHDPRCWHRPDRFDPERFAAGGPETDPYAFIPQGGGDARTGHRCPGEQLTVELTKVSVAHLLRFDHRLPPQDLRIPAGRIPGRPRSRLELTPPVRAG